MMGRRSERDQLHQDAALAGVDDQDVLGIRGPEVRRQGRCGRSRRRRSRLLGRLGGGGQGQENGGRREAAPDETVQRPTLARSASLTRGLTNLVTSPPRVAISLTSLEATAW